MKSHGLAGLVLLFVATTLAAEESGVLGRSFEERTFITSAGDVRHYLIRLPLDYDDDKTLDILFSFHGAGSNSVAHSNYVDFSALADRDGVILVMPDANKRYVDQKHTLAEYWNSAWEANLRERDYDLDFVLELVAALRNEFSTARFLATGMSAGGDVTSALQCLPGSPFSAYAPVTYRYYNEKECAGAPARPVISFHGDEDQVVPISGSGDPWNDPPVALIMQRWAQHNGCAVTPVETRISAEVVRIHWLGCSAAVEWYRVEGGGHTWPGAIALDGYGHTTTEIDASEFIWRFFFDQSG